MTHPNPVRHLAHGLADDAVSPDWPPLVDDEVRAVLAAYPNLAGPTTIRWRSPRPFSAAARVATRGGEVFVKRHHQSVRTPQDLAVEHAFMAHLRDRGIPVPAVFAAGDDVSAVSRGPWVYEVHALARGVDVYRDTPSWTPLVDLPQARSAGRMLARLHVASAGFDVPPRRTAILAARAELLAAPDFERGIEVAMATRPALADYVSPRPWREELAQVASLQRRVQARVAAATPLWTHNDWHVSNLCWSDATADAEVTDVLDFGLAARCFALYDLATAIERNAIAWLHLGRGAAAAFPATARALVEGYAGVLPLDAAARAFLADLLPVVHLDFALAEVEYFCAVTHSRAHADVAYDTFLRGHAAWFATPQGQGLLTAIDPDR